MELNQPVKNVTVIHKNDDDNFTFDLLFGIPQMVWLFEIGFNGFGCCLVPFLLSGFVIQQRFENVCPKCKKKYAGPTFFLKRRSQKCLESSLVFLGVATRNGWYVLTTPQNDIAAIVAHFLDTFLSFFSWWASYTIRQSTQVCFHWIEFYSFYSLLQAEQSILHFYVE